MKSFRMIILVAFAAVLSGCATNIVNPKPYEAPDAEIAALEQAAIKARAARQCDVLTLAEQTKRVLLLTLPLQKHHQWLYEERRNGRDYSKEMKERTEKAIRDNWELAEGAANLYSLSAVLNTELSDKGKSVAKAMLEIGDSTDEVIQLGLGYTIAGLEWNAGYLTAEKETYFNDILKKNEALASKTSVLMKAFVARIAAQAGNGKAAACPDAPVSPGKKANSLSILFEGSADENKSLEEAILQVTTRTPLATRYKGVTITLNVVAMDEYGAARTLMNIFTFFKVGYSRGGDASLSAFVREEGGNKIPLAIDTFELNAKNADMLILLVANRVVGRAHFALLRQDMSF